MPKQTVLITGANHGIGAASAAAFCKQGARVFLTAYRPPPALSEAEMQTARATGAGGPALYAAMQQQPLRSVLARLTDSGADAAGLEMDLAAPNAVSRLFDACEDAVGAVDVLVINHTHDVLETFDPARARSEGFAIHLVSAEEIDRHFAVNARATALLIAEYTRRFLQRGLEPNRILGRIITVSTDAAHAHPENVSYAASKHAVESYSRSAAAELGRYGITVNIVAPGPIQTGYITPEAEREIAAGTPLGRVGKPEDVADVILFLASPAARWLTGQLLYVGGGWRMGQ